ncbi:MAG: radical SAM protein, partial [Leptospiraceae bacterium]|nr:radical SAM protein [Leptospiraceae bacterium]
MKFDDYVPDNFTLQWHITDTCNFRCSHCYQDNYSSRGETLENWKEILHQFLALVSIWRTKNPGIKIHINVTGGEPFTHPDFFSLLELFHANKKKFSYGILSNGSLLNSEKSNRLKSLEPGFVQVSLEGGKKANDKIRGNGSFEKIRKGIRNLKKNNL